MTGVSDPLAELVTLVQAQRGLLLEVLSPDGPERTTAFWYTALAALPELDARVREYLAACSTEPERRYAAALLEETRQRTRATGLLVLTLARLGRTELAAYIAAHGVGERGPSTYAPAGQSGSVLLDAPLLFCQDA